MNRDALEFLTWFGKTTLLSAKFSSTGVVLVGSFGSAGIWDAAEGSVAVARAGAVVAVAEVMAEVVAVAEVVAGTEVEDEASAVLVMDVTAAVTDDGVAAEVEVAWFVIATDLEPETDIDPNFPPLPRATVSVELDRAAVSELALDVGPVDVGPVDVGPVDVGPVDVGPVDVGAVELDAAELDASEVELAGPATVVVGAFDETVMSFEAIVVPVLSFDLIVVDVAAAA